MLFPLVLQVQLDIQHTSMIMKSVRSLPSTELPLPGSDVVVLCSQPPTFLVTEECFSFDPAFLTRLIQSIMYHGLRLFDLMSLAAAQLYKQHAWSSTDRHTPSGRPASAGDVLRAWQFLRSTS